MIMPLATAMQMYILKHDHKSNTLDKSSKKLPVERRQQNLFTSIKKNNEKWVPFFF